MDTKWITEELHLWNDLNDPGDRGLVRLSHKVRRLPAGKNKAKLQQQITKARARQFASGWSAFRSLMTH